MIVPFACPACGATIEAELKGLKRRVVTCASCKEQVQVPDGIGIGPGVTIGNGYKLERKLGESSLGDNYLATREGRQFVVEILSGETSRDQEKVTRLMQETDLMTSLKHPNIVEAIEAGQDNENYFLVTAYEAGQMLNEYLAERGFLSSNEALSIGIDIAEALRHAWEGKKILHRDIKPQSIFITESGRAKLTGFGIAKSSEGQSLGLTGIGFTIGTPEYMSPEQIRAADDLDFRADLYSLGVVLYECVVGALPFEETAPMLLVQKHMDEVPESPNRRNQEVTPACSALIDRMLLKDRNERQTSWQALIADMKAAQSGGGAKSAAAGFSADGEEQDSSKTMALIIGGGVILVLILVAIIVYLMKQ